MPAYLGRQPQHGQGLARPLGVPDHAAPFVGLLAREDAGQGGPHCPVLLVAGDLLDQPSPLRLVDHIVPEDVQQDRRGQHSHDELVLSLRFHPELLPHLVVRVGRHRLPLEVGVLRSVQRGVGRGGPAVGHTQQVVVEELRGSPALPLWPRLLVAAQLPNRPGLPDVHQGRRLGFHHHQGYTVHEEDQVGNDQPLIVLGTVPLAAPAHPKLGGDHELLETALGVVEVEEADGARVPPPGAIDVQGHPEGQILVDRLVAGHAYGVDVLQLEDNPVGLSHGEPLVEAQEGGTEDTVEQHLAFTAPLHRQGFSGHVGPPQPVQQLSGRFLGVVEFVEFVWGGHKCYSQVGLPQREDLRIDAVKP